MNKKIIVFGSFLAFFIMMLVPIGQAVGYNLVENENKNTITYTYFFETLGPRDSTISKITFQNGSFQNKSLTWFNLMYTISLRLIFFIIPLTRPIGYAIIKDKIDFTVEYKKDKSIDGPFSFRGCYYTKITEVMNGNLTNNTIVIFNEKHTVKVEGFSYGSLVYFKRSMLLVPSFGISGVCDNYTLIK